MGKKLFIIAFIICVAGSGYLFWQKSSGSSKQEDGTADKKADLIIEDFVIYRYRGNKLNSFLNAKLGQLKGGTLVEVDGEVEGSRLKEGKWETFNSESAVGYFKNRIDAATNGDVEQLERVELSNLVEVALNGYILSTDYAEYISKNDEVISPKPVRIDGPGRVFSGEEGFSYSLKNEVLNINGQVNGRFEDNLNIQ